MTNVRALFEIPFDADVRLPVLPLTSDSSDFAVFDGDPIQGWAHVHNENGTPPTVTILICTSASQMAAHKANPDLLWLADVGSPVHDEPVTAQGAKATVDWLKAHGYAGAEFGQALAAIQARRTRRGIVDGVCQGLHNSSVENAERLTIAM